MRETMLSYIYGTRLIINGKEYIEKGVNPISRKGELMEASPNP